MAREIGGTPLLDLVVEETHSCYLGDRTPPARLGLRLRHMSGVPAAGDGYARFISERAMTNEKRRLIEGIVFLVAFGLTIPAANWMIGNVGTICAPNGPCVIPVAPT